MSYLHNYHKNSFHSLRANYMLRASYVCVTFIVHFSSTFFYLYRLSGSPTVWGIDPHPPPAPGQTPNYSLVMVVISFLLPVLSQSVHGISSMTRIGWGMGPNLTGTSDFWGEDLGHRRASRSIFLCLRENVREDVFLCGWQAWTFGHRSGGVAGLCRRAELGKWQRNQTKATAIGEPSHCSTCNKTNSAQHISAFLEPIRIGNSVTTAITSWLKQYVNKLPIITVIWDRYYNGLCLQIKKESLGGGGGVERACSFPRPRR